MRLRPVLIFAATMGLGCGLFGGDDDDDGVSIKKGDCNDNDATVSPEMPELCNGVDDDCDGIADDVPIDGDLYYPDDDDDGFGDSEREFVACARPDGYATEGGDCDDDDEDVNPDVDDDDLDGVDDNCDGEPDDGAPFDVEAVLPGGASVEGGREVVVRGEGFSDAVEVEVDGVPADIVDVTETELRFEAPEADEAGTVDMVVRRGSNEHEQEFVYFDDASGASTLYGFVAWYDYPGSYWSGDPTFGRAYLVFSEPNDATGLDWFAGTTTLDTCNAFEGLASLVDREPDVDAMRLECPVGSSVALEQDRTYHAVYTGEFTTSQFADQGDYGVSGPSGDDWPAFELEGMARLPRAFTVSKPDIDGSSPPTVTRDAFAVSWSGSGGDFVVIVATMLNSSGSQRDHVECLARDDGSFTIPSSAWTRWETTTGTYIELQVMRVNADATTTVPFDESSTALLSNYVVVGAVYPG